MRHNEGHQRTAPTWLCARVGGAMQGPRRRASGCGSSASGAGGARLHRRAPSVGIPAGAVTVGSRTLGSVDAMLHGIRR
jgi:hypothetical protein